MEPVSGMIMLRMILSRYRALLVSTIAVSLALFGGLFGGVELYRQSRYEMTRVLQDEAQELSRERAAVQHERERARDLEQRIMIQRDELLRYKLRLDSISYLLESGGSRPRSYEELVAGISTVRAEVDSVSARIGRLETEVMASPEKAVALPLLRRDVAELRSTLDQQFEASRITKDAEITALRREIDRVSDLMKWVFGLMFPLTASIIGVIINGIVTARRELKKEESSSAEARSV